MYPCCKPANAGAPVNVPPEMPAHVPLQLCPHAVESLTTLTGEGLLVISIASVSAAAMPGLAAIPGSDQHLSVKRVTKWRTLRRAVGQTMEQGGEGKERPPR